MTSKYSSYRPNAELEIKTIDWTGVSNKVKAATRAETIESYKQQNRAEDKPTHLISKRRVVFKWKLNDLSKGKDLLNSA